MLAERTTAATQIAGVELHPLACTNAIYTHFCLWQQQFCISILIGIVIGSGMLTQEGRCKTLDVSADGYVRAETGTIVLMSILRGWGDETCKMPEVILSGSHINQVPTSSPFKHMLNNIGIYVELM